MTQTIKEKLESEYETRERIRDENIRKTSYVYCFLSVAQIRQILNRAKLEAKIKYGKVKQHSCIMLEGRLYEKKALEAGHLVILSNAGGALI